MPILYSLVARGATVLVEYAEARGNFTEVARTLLSGIDIKRVQEDPAYAVVVPKPGQRRGPGAAPLVAKRRLSYLYDDHYFHMLTEQETGLIYVCMADEETGRRIPFGFLDNLLSSFRERFTLQFLERTATQQLSLESQYRPKMKEIFEQFNDPESDQISRVKNQINEIKDVMAENIEKILLREEKIDLLIEKTDTLSRSSVVFRRDARQLRNIMWWRNCKVWISICSVVALLVLICVWWGCGIKFDKC